MSLLAERVPCTLAGELGESGSAFSYGRGMDGWWDGWADGSANG